MSPSEKLTIILAAHSFSIGILYSHSTGTAFPGLPIGGGAAVIFLAIGVLRNRSISIGILAAVVGLGVLYRTYAFLFPASLISIDPDGYAVRSLIIAQTGSLNQLIDGFYSIAAMFVVLIAEMNLVSGLPIDQSMIAIPILAGVLIPLAAFSIASSVSGSRHAGLIAAVLCTLGPTTVRFGIRPVPIFLGALLFTVIAILLTKFQEENPLPYLIAFLITLIAMLFTHKLPILLVIAVLGALIILSIEPLGYSFKNRRLIAGLFLIACSFLVVQWIFLTEFVAMAYIRLLALIGIQPILSPAVRTAAVPYDPSLAQKLAVFGFAFVLLLLGGVTWLYLWVSRRDNSRISRLLALVSPPVALSIPGLFLSVLAGFYRVFFYATALVSGLIAVGYRVTQVDLRRAVYAAFVFTILLALITQPVSRGVSPDYMDGTREYLTIEEVAAKEHVNTYSDKVWMDRYYKDEVVNFQRAAEEGGQTFQTQGIPSSAPGVLTTEFTNRTLLNQDYKHILLRTDLTVYRLTDGRRWTLTWDPVQGMSSTPRYNQVYSNGGAIHYVRLDNQTVN